MTGLDGPSWRDVCQGSRLDGPSWRAVTTARHDGSCVAGFTTVHWCWAPVCSKDMYWDS